MLLSPSGARLPTQILTRGASHGAIAYSNLVRMEVKDW